MTYLVEKTFRALRLVVGCEVVVWPSPDAIWIECGNYISLAEALRDGIEGEPTTEHLLREHEDGCVLIIREVANVICIYRLSGLLVRTGCAPERVPIRHSVILPACPVVFRITIPVWWESWIAARRSYRRITLEGCKS